MLSMSIGLCLEPSAFVQSYTEPKNSNPQNTGPKRVLANQAKGNKAQKDDALSSTTHKQGQALHC